MKIFIDPGHGGSDPGAVGINGTRESDVVLKVGLKLKEILINNGFTVRMSRETDEYVSLTKRAELANKTAADLFISIHCNGFTNPDAKGSEVYSYPGNAQAEKLAGILLWHICNGIGTANRGTRKENFAVLRLSKMPAVLVETAFITNPDEEKMMCGGGFAEKAAYALAKGICEFCGVTLSTAETEGENFEHWGSIHLENLLKKGYIKNPELWKDFDKSPTAAMVLALADKITGI